MKTHQTELASSDDAENQPAIVRVTPALVTLVVPLNQRKYRIRRHDPGFSVVMTRPNAAGGVTIARDRFPDLQTAIDFLLRSIVQHFEGDFEPLMKRFDTDYGAWLQGKPGIRARSPMWKRHVEDIGNHLCRLGEAYAQAYLEAVALATSHGCNALHIANHWLDGAHESITRGVAGKHIRLEDLVRRSTPPSR